MTGKFFKYFTYNKGFQLWWWQAKSLQLFQDQFQLYNLDQQNKNYYIMTIQEQATVLGGFGIYFFFGLSFLFVWFFGFFWLTCLDIWTLGIVYLFFYMCYNHLPLLIFYEFLMLFHNHARVGGWNNSTIKVNVLPVGSMQYSPLYPHSGSSTGILPPGQAILLPS